MAIIDDTGEKAAPPPPISEIKPPNLKPVDTSIGESPSPTWAKEVYLPTLEADVFAAEAAWKSWQQKNRGRFDLTEGTVFKVVETQDVVFGADGKEYPETQKVGMDPEGQKLYDAYITAKEALENGKALLKNGAFKGMGGAAGTGAAALSAPALVPPWQLEQMKSDEARRRFLDALDRMKAVYYFEDADQAFSMRAADQQAETQAAIQKGLIDPGQGVIWGTGRMAPDYASIIGQTVPAEVLPDYQPDYTAGMPGADLYHNPLPGEGEFVSKFAPYGVIPTFADGTPRGRLSPRLPGQVVDPEIAWMLSRPDIAFNPTSKPVPVPRSWQRRRDDLHAQQRGVAAQPKPTPKPAAQLPGGGV